MNAIRSLKNRSSDLSTRAVANSQPVQHRTASPCSIEKHRSSGLPGHRSSSLQRFKTVFPPCFDHQTGRGSETVCSDGQRLAEHACSDGHRLAEHAGRGEQLGAESQRWTGQPLEDRATPRQPSGGGQWSGRGRAANRSGRPSADSAKPILL